MESQAGFSGSSQLVCLMNGHTERAVYKCQTGVLCCQRHLVAECSFCLPFFSPPSLAVLLAPPHCCNTNYHWCIKFCRGGCCCCLISFFILIVFFKGNKLEGFRFWRENVVTSTNRKSVVDCCNDLSGRMSFFFVTVWWFIVFTEMLTFQSLFPPHKLSFLVCNHYPWH